MTKTRKQSKKDKEKSDKNPEKSLDTINPSGEKDDIEKETKTDSDPDIETGDDTVEKETISKQEFDEFRNHTTKILENLQILMLEKHTAESHVPPKSKNEEEKSKLKIPEEEKLVFTRKELQEIVNQQLQVAGVTTNIPQIRRTSRPYPPEFDLIPYPK